MQKNARHVHADFLEAKKYTRVVGRSLKEVLKKNPGRVPLLFRSKEVLPAATKEALRRDKGS